MHKILVIRLYFHYTLYMFRTVLVHLQEQPFISCMSYLVYADTTYSLQNYSERRKNKFHFRPVTNNCIDIRGVITRAMTSRMPKLAREIHHTAEIRIANKIQSDRTKVKDDLGEQCLSLRTILKAIFTKYDVRMWTIVVCSKQGKVPGSVEEGEKSPDI